MKTIHTIYLAVVAALLPLVAYSQQAAPPAALPAVSEVADDARLKAVLAALDASRSFWLRQIRFDSSKQYWIGIDSLSAPDVGGIGILDRDPYYRVTIDRKNRRKSLGGGRYICIIHRETGEIVSVTRDR